MPVLLSLRLNSSTFYYRQESSNSMDSQSTAQVPTLATDAVLVKSQFDTTGAQVCTI